MITKLKITTTKFLDRAVDVLKTAISKVNASGKTVDSINFELKDNENGIKAKVYAREFTSLIESGRRPTNKNPSPEMIKNLTEYAKIRGMDKPKSAAWAIAKKMNKEGDKTFKQAGREIYSDELDKEIEIYTKEVLNDFSDFVVNDLVAQFKK